ncbi:MAG: hypothetical protein PVS2B1_06880 [Candidatus Dormibacteraceae bacterium]
MRPRVTLDVVSVDAEGYGFPEHQVTLARLMDDIRVLSPAGVERVAMGWDKHVGQKGLEAFHAAEKAAIHAIEQADRGPAWDEVRRSLFGMTESGDALVSWKAEHGEIGHKAEQTGFGAALGIVASGLISKEQRATLVRPMAEALPWLLPEENRPEP